MSSSASKQLGSNTAPTGRSPLRRAIYFAVLMAFLAVPMFVAAGRLDWWGGWLFVGAYLGGGMVGMLIVSHLNPEGMQARTEKHEGTKPWDRVLLRVYALMCLLTTVVAGLDAGRYGWSPPIPLALCIVAIVVLEVSQGLSAWAAAANAHLDDSAYPERSGTASVYFWSISLRASPGLSGVHHHLDQRASDHGILVGAYPCWPVGCAVRHPHGAGRPHAARGPRRLPRVRRTSALSAIAGGMVIHATQQEDKT